MNGHYQEKIVDRDGLVTVLEQVRANQQSVVLCHGCFDIVHPGHIRYLEYARKHGDLLIVSITGDAAIDKDFDRPYIPEELRPENLAVLEVVDLVYIDPHHTACNVIETIRPDVYVKGEEYSRSKDQRFLEEQRLVEQHGGKVIFSSGDVVFSSTELIRRMGRDSDLDARRREYLCRRHDINALTIAAIMERFHRKRVLVIGDIVIDRYVICDTIDVAEESPMMSLKQLNEHTYLGGAAIVARHVAQLGAEVTLCTQIGSDDFSKSTLKKLKSENVETVVLSRDSGPVVKTRFLVEGTKLLKVENAETHPLDTRAIRKATRLALDRAHTVDAAVFCDFGFGVVTEGLLQELLPELRQAVEVITADVSGSRGNLLNFKNVDMFCPTEREIRATLHSFDVGLSDVAWHLLEATQARHLIATMGQRGLVAFDRQSQDPGSPDWNGRLRIEYLQAMNGHATDVLGCGDALLSGNTLALCCGASFIQAAYLGNAMAAIEAGEVGNIPISAQRLSQWLDARPEIEQATEQQAMTALLR